MCVKPYSTDEAMDVYGERPVEEVMADMLGGVRLIQKSPPNSPLAKKCWCANCGSLLQYFPRDLFVSRGYDTIKCPVCSYDTAPSSWPYKGE